MDNFLSDRQFKDKWEDNPHAEWDARAMAVHAAMIDRMWFPGQAALLCYEDKPFSPPFVPNHKVPFASSNKVMTELLVIVVESSRSC